MYWTISFDRSKAILLLEGFEIALYLWHNMSANFLPFIVLFEWCTFDLTETY